MTVPNGGRDGGKPSARSNQGNSRAGKNASADGNVELDGLFVDPDIWRQGVGRSLLAHCVKDAVASGAASLWVVGNPHAQGFYEACGFMVIEESQTRFGPGLTMRRDISELSLP